MRHRLVEWRHTWWFRHAHHPLCTPYAGDVLTLGKLELCRSCTLVYGTLCAAAPLLFFWNVAARPDWAVSFLLLAAVAAGLSCPPIYRRLPRLAKDGARTLLGLLIAAWIVSALAGQFLLAGASALPLLALHRVYGRLRQGPESRERCETCPEYREGTICSGFTRQAEAHRALEEIWSEARMARGTPPPADPPPTENSRPDR